MPLLIKKMNKIKNLFTRFKKSWKKKQKKTQQQQVSLFKQGHNAVPIQILGPIFCRYATDCTPLQFKNCINCLTRTKNNKNKQKYLCINFEDFNTFLHYFYQVNYYNNIL